ncbi:MAG: transglycosylase domain-containing protein [Deltaproteobacteria bacterium]|nr:transglycosylase domain-containing protein [Deltaproteobacteria bacterium]
MASRRKRIAVAASVGVPLVAGALAWGWWIPSAIEARFEDALRARFGVTCDVGDVDLRMRGAVISDVSITGSAGGVQITIDEIGARIGLVSALFEGAAALEEVQARRVLVEVDLAHVGVDASLDALHAGVGSRTGAGAGQGDATAGSAAASEVVFGAVGVHVSVDDEWGRLLTVRDSRARLEGEGFEGRAAAVTVGVAPFDTLSADDLEVAGVRGAEGILLSGFEVGAGEVVWASRGADAEGERPEATLSRLAAALSRLRGSSAEPVAEETDLGEEAPWLRRLTSGALIEVSQVAVRTRTPGGEESPIVTGLEASLEKLEVGRIRVKGEGNPGDGGTLGWDLSVSPADLRAQGSLRFEDLPLALVAPLVPEVPWFEPERSLLTGELEVDGGAGERVGLRGRVALSGLALSSPRIAPEPLRGISLVVAGEGAFYPQTRRLEVHRGTLQMGDAEVVLSGTLEHHGDRYLVDVAATLPPTSCTDAIGAIPISILGGLAGFSFTGQIGGRVTAKVDSESLAELELDINVSDGCRFETVPAMADLARVAGPFLHRVHEPDGSWFEMSTGPGSGNWSSIYRINPYLIHAVLAHEDASFFRHSGFAPWAIREALSRNLSEGRFLYGASTISMQLAKNLFLHREKYLARKVQEVLLTWWLEKALDKAQLLELYLNIIEYGPALYGITRASEHYFGVEAEDLSPAQSAFLACILPNPKAFHDQWEENTLREGMKNRMRRLLTHMRSRGRIDQGALDYALGELETFRFFHEGDPLPPLPEVPGTAGELPFATALGWDDDWDRWGDGGFDDAYEESPADPL